MILKRDIERHLEVWIRDTGRSPLLVRGARQTGKSHTVKEIGRRNFENIAEVNFEQHPEYGACFNSLEPQEILEALSILQKKPLKSGRTLLFLDEIQQCPQALLSLRYFYEQMPELHVIAAGSLLEFAFASEEISVPVGRIQYVYIKPLSFGEFLEAMGEGKARQFIRGVDLVKGINAAVHEHLLKLVRKYLILGGMPAVLKEYVETGDMAKCSQIQTLITRTYRDDFGKYASRVKHKYLEKVFSGVPRLVGRKFKYSSIDREVQSRDLKEAVDLLEKAGVLYRVSRTSGAGHPLGALVSDRHFKLVFLDVGLMQNLCGGDIASDVLMTDDVLEVNAGALAEQFVGQEIVAHQLWYRESALYYWEREARNSSAEVDYLVSCGNKVVPVEVKAGTTGRLKSLRMFIGKYGIDRGIRISQRPLEREPTLLSIPIYAIEAMERMYLSP